MKNDNDENKMNWFTKHVDTVVVLSGILASVFWMNGKFNELDNRFNIVEKDIVMIKTVMIMKNIMPADLAKKDGEK